MIISSPEEAVKHYGDIASRDGVSGAIFMVGQFVVEIHTWEPTPFSTTHIEYPFVVEDGSDGQD